MSGEYYINHLKVLVTFRDFGDIPRTVNWLFWNQRELSRLHFEWVHYTISRAIFLVTFEPCLVRIKEDHQLPSKKVELDWEATIDPNYVAEDVWEDKPSPWTCTTWRDMWRWNTSSNCTIVLWMWRNMDNVVRSMLKIVRVNIYV